MPVQTITLIGAGNLGYHLARTFHSKGFCIQQIYSRAIANAKELAALVNAEPIDDLQTLVHADLLVICVTDSAIQVISDELPVFDSIVVHTSGSTPMEVLHRHSRHGVFYPLQTFSKGFPVDFQNIPLLLESSSFNVQQELMQVANKISNSVFSVDSLQRQKLHLAAVFACNFTNHMMAVASSLLKEANLPFSMLENLILETVQKAIKSGNPESVQTGPAIRGNLGIMQAHSELLKDKLLWQKIYTFVSESIIEMGKGGKAGYETF